MSLRVAVLTDRLELRLPLDHDRRRFLELFTDHEFMVFAGVCTVEQAHERFDHMCETATEVDFAKQPVIERETGAVVGYCGADWFDFEGEPCLEFGYRLCTSARNMGYATEAGRALIDLARDTWAGTIYAMIDPQNKPSMRVIAKLGFGFWKQADIDGHVTNLYRVSFPDSNL